MSVITCVMLIFSIIGALDRIFHNRFGLGEEFERGFKLLGTMSLSMSGMIIISPFLAQLLSPVFSFVWESLSLDPSIIPASLFANDMGGAPLSVEVAKNADIGLFNALVVSSMMGATISFTIPYALTVTDKKNHSDILLGFLCGIVTIPLGCFVSGLILSIPLAMLIINVLPLIFFSIIIAAGLVLCPNVCVKIFAVLGDIIKIIITSGLVLGVIKFLSGIEIIKGLESIEEATMVCLNASCVISGAFPLLKIISKIISRPVKKLGNKIGINEVSALGLVSTLATNVTTFDMIKNMDRKGIVLNSAFAVSAAFTLAGHLAFTMAFDGRYVAPVCIGKIIAGLTSLLIAVFVAKKNVKE